MEQLLKGRPDNDRENPKYVSEMIEVLSWLTPEEHQWLTHPREGLHTRCKFLPTPADVHEFIRTMNERLAPYRNQPKPRHLTFSEEARIEQPAADRRKAQVEQALGYNPQRREQKPRGPLVVPSEEEVRAVYANLKTPAAPMTAAFRKWCAEQGLFSRPQNET